MLQSEGAAPILHSSKGNLLSLTYIAPYLPGNQVGSHAYPLSARSHSRLPPLADRPIRKRVFQQGGTPFPQRHPQFSGAASSLLGGPEKSSPFFEICQTPKRSLSLPADFSCPQIRGQLKSRRISLPKKQDQPFWEKSGFGVGLRFKR